MQCYKESNMNTRTGTVRGYRRRGSHGLGRLCMNTGVQAIIVFFCGMASVPAIQAKDFSCPAGEAGVDCLTAAILEHNTFEGAAR
jgi:hypothetical protein